jgi:hypothetical protein
MRLQHWATVVAARPFMYSCFSFRGWAMKISNVHERTIAAPSALVGALLDTLASVDDKIWPHENWPGVKFNLPLQVGATGGHGTGPYTVSSYTLGRHLRFEFGGGRQGYHEFTLQEVDDMTCLLRHALKARLTFNSVWRWYFLIRPLHNALIEDLFDKVESQVAKVEHRQVWSAHVQKLRQERGMSPVMRRSPTCRLVSLKVPEASTMATSASRPLPTAVMAGNAARTSSEMPAKINFWRSVAPIAWACPYRKPKTADRWRESVDICFR